MKVVIDLITDIIVILVSVHIALVLTVTTVMVVTGSTDHLIIIVITATGIMAIVHNVLVSIITMKKITENKEATALVQTTTIGRMANSVHIAHVQITTAVKEAIDHTMAEKGHIIMVKDRTIVVKDHTMVVKGHTIVDLLTTVTTIIQTVHSAHAATVRITDMIMEVE